MELEFRTTRVRKGSDTYSNYKGVSFNSSAKKWSARITIAKKTITLGYYDTEELAAQAYAESKIKYAEELTLKNTHHWELVPNKK